MRNLIMIISLLSFVALRAQNCVVSDLGLAPSTGGLWGGAIKAGDGTMRITMWDAHDLGDVILTHTDANGAPMLSSYIATVNPAVRLHPKSIVPSSDGGSAVFGYTVIGPGYENYFIVRTDNAGAVLWARYYMMSSDSSYDVPRSSSLLPLPNNELIMGLSRGNGAVLVKLDDQGVPVWQQRYAGTQTNEYWTNPCYDVRATASGDILMMGQKNDHALWLCKADANGNVIWSHEYQDVAPTWIYAVPDRQVLPLSSGDILVLVRDQVLRFGSDGSYQWSRTFPELYEQGSRGVKELSNSDLLIACSRVAVRLSPAGDLVSAWQNDPNTFWAGIVENDDAVTCMERSRSDLSIQDLLIVPTAGDLDCLGTPFTPSVTATPGPSSITDTIAMRGAAIKTWTMALGPAVEYNELDIEGWSNSTGARPGFAMQYWCGVDNARGRTSGPITATLAFDPSLTITSITPPPSSSAPGSVTWNLPALSGFSVYESPLRVLLNIPANTPLGVPLAASFTVTQDSAETDLVNNTYDLTTITTSSFDPNEKVVSPAPFYHITNDSTLDYTIRFQNTGTDTAFTVVVRDTLPLDVDVSTFKMGASSHPCTYSLTGNGILTFTFDNILLPDSTTNEAASHGAIGFRIRPLQPLTLGQHIRNAADIYFDFNDPVRTNTTDVEVYDGTGVRPRTTPPVLRVYPVPAKNSLTAITPADFTCYTAQAIDAIGRRIPLPIRNNAGSRVVLNTDHLEPGAYILTLLDRNGRRLSARFTKE